MTVYYRTYKTDEDALKKLTKQGSHSCFDGIQLYWNGKTHQDKFYFAYISSSKIKKAIEEFNNFFKNIKVVIVGVENDLYDAENGTPIYIMTIEMNDKYTNKSIYFMTIAIAIFMRCFCSAYAFYDDSSKIKENFINEMLNVFNKHTNTYGALLYKKIMSREEWNKLDNIEYMNKLTKEVEVDNYIYVSRLMGK